MLAVGGALTTAMVVLSVADLKLICRISSTRCAALRGSTAEGGQQRTSNRGANVLRHSVVLNSCILPAA